LEAIGLLSKLAAQAEFQKGVLNTIPVIADVLKDRYTYARVRLAAIELLSRLAAQSESREKALKIIPTTITKGRQNIVQHK